MITELMVLQANYSNLREQNLRLTKQAVKMAALFKRIANDAACDYQAQAADLLKFFEAEVKI